MRQFYRGSGIAVFFYAVIFAYAAMSIASVIQIDEQNREYAAYWGELSDVNSMSDATSDRGMLLIIFFAVAFLLLVNIFGVTRYWIKMKHSEFRARTIVGGSSVAVCAALTLNYISIILTAFIIGMLCAFLILQSDLLFIHSQHFLMGVPHILKLSFLFFTTGVLIGAGLIWKKQKDLPGGTQ